MNNSPQSHKATKRHEVFNFLRRRFAWFGLAGSAVVTGFSLITALAYGGRNNEPYSVFNHFISELGEMGVSSFAYLFNAGLITGGLLFFIFVLGLGFAIPGKWPKLALVAGIVASLSLIGVGIFPMNHLEPHITAAMTYFRAGLMTLLLYGFAIQLQPKGQNIIDKRANLAGLLAATCYSAFLVYIQFTPAQGSNPLDLSWLNQRPSLWPLALLEWLIFFSTLVWFFVISITWTERATR